MCSGSVGCPVPTDTSWFPQISGVGLGVSLKSAYVMAQYSDLIDC